MNAPFSAVFRTLNGTAASLSALHETLRRMEAETRTALRLNDQNRERRVCAVQDATDELLEDFAHEYDTLKGDAESLLSAAEIAMNDILDPHFHRMQPQYFSAAMQKPYNTANVCAEALIARMQKALSAIQAGAKKIKNAFLLPDAAGLIGSVSPDFRKSLYMPILDAYSHMRRCAEAIENAPAFTEKVARAHAVCTRKTRQIEAECTNRRGDSAKIKGRYRSRHHPHKRCALHTAKRCNFRRKRRTCPAFPRHAAHRAPLRQNVYSAAYLYKARPQRAVFNG